MSFSYSGEGQALVIKEKCSSIKKFTSSSNFYDYSNGFYKLNYENSVIGKKLLSSIYTAESDNLIASDGLLNYELFPLYLDETPYLLIFIAGVQKEYKYSSFELQKIDSFSTSTAANNFFKSKAKSADESHKLLESNSSLKKVYLKLK